MHKTIPQDVIDQLIKLANKDLKIRSKLLNKNELTKYGYHPTMKQIHENNIHYLQKFLEEYGWPRPSQYGKELFEAAWIISIHAIEKRKQMKQALKSIKTLLDEGEEVGYQYACMYDRINLYEGRRQVYGTQLFPTSEGWQPLNLENYKKADIYRLKLGLPTIADKIQEFINDGELGYIDNEQEHLTKFEKWLDASEWRKTEIIENGSQLDK